MYLVGQDLKVVDKVKFLGTTFDKRLNWQEYIANITNKAIPRSFQVTKIAQCLDGKDTKLVLDLFNFLITSLFDYLSVAFAPMANTHWQQIHNTQMRALKSGAGVPRRTPDRVIFDTVDVEPLRETIMQRAKQRFDKMNKDNKSLEKYQRRHAELSLKRPTNKSPYVFSPLTGPHNCYHCLFYNALDCAPLPNQQTGHV